MNRQPTVSLVMPSYQRGPKIARALESVLRQTRVPNEIIVVNDGGFPATTEWVTQYYPQVRLLNVDHGGAALARNRGVEAASGEVLILFDDDDELLPHAVETLLAVLNEFPEARAGHCDSSLTNLVSNEYVENHHFAVPAFRRLRDVRVLKQTARARLYGKDLYYSMLWGNLLQQPWAVYRETYRQVGGFRSGLGSCDDWDLYLRIARTAKIAQSDEVIARHYVEKDKPHLTKAANQEEGLIRGLILQLSDCPWYDVRARSILRLRLARFYKGAGDRVFPQSLREAWRQYVRSICIWPFDHVVLARTLLWSFSVALGRR